MVAASKLSAINSRQSVIPLRTQTKPTGSFVALVPLLRVGLLPFVPLVIRSLSAIYSLKQKAKSNFSWLSILLLHLQLLLLPKPINHVTLPPPKTEVHAEDRPLVPITEALNQTSPTPLQPPLVALPTANSAEQMATMQTSVQSSHPLLHQPLVMKILLVHFTLNVMCKTRMLRTGLPTLEPIDT
ncbi:hypothetical protein Hanom_Chr16g01504801 [Helianthus anomalus]